MFDPDADRRIAVLEARIAKIETWLGPTLGGEWQGITDSNLSDAG